MNIQVYYNISKRVIQRFRYFLIFRYDSHHLPQELLYLIHTCICKKWLHNFQHILLSVTFLRSRRLSKQEDFTWQEIWGTFIHLFKGYWNDHLVNYFPLMHCYRINTNISHSTFSRAECWSFRIKCYSLQEKTN